jgi:hypothetical protein
MTRSTDSSRTEPRRFKRIPSLDDFKTRQLVDAREYLLGEYDQFEDASDREVYLHLAWCLDRELRLRDRRRKPRIVVSPFTSDGGPK